MNQIILACDDNGKFLEYIPKEMGHTGEGKRHLAITVLIYRRSLKAKHSGKPSSSAYNNKDQILLQKRKHKVFDDIWDIGATHPLHSSDGKDESLEQAAKRCLKDEYGITGVNLKNIGAFNYFAKDGENCENEHCFLLVGEYNGEVSLNKEMGYEYKWMDKKELLEDMEKNPENYSIWANDALKIYGRR